jgi:hypothetical protein
MWRGLARMLTRLQHHLPCLPHARTAEPPALCRPLPPLLCTCSAAAAAARPHMRLQLPARTPVRSPTTTHDMQRSAAQRSAAAVFTAAELQRRQLQAPSHPRGSSCSATTSLKPSMTRPHSSVKKDITKHQAAMKP